MSAEDLTELVFSWYIHILLLRLYTVYEQTQENSVYLFIYFLEINVIFLEEGNVMMYRN